MDLTQNKNTLLLAGIGVVFFLGIFLYTTLEILSPIVIGFLLLILLAGLAKIPLANRLSTIVTIILLLWIFLHAQGVFIPFILSFILAYLFQPIADQMEKWKFPRILAVLIIMLLTLGTVIFFSIILIPNLIIDMGKFVLKLPALINQIGEFLLKHLASILSYINVDPDAFMQDLKDELPNRLQSTLMNIGNSLSSVGAILGQLFNLVIIPILTFYLLKDYSEIQAWALDFVPKKFRSVYSFYLWRLNRIIGGYIRGQIIVGTIVGVLTGLGLLLFSIPFAILLGFLAGVLNIVPYFGLYSSLGIALLTGLLSPEPFAAAVKIVGVFMSVNIIEAYVVSPKILGERVGLHPLAVIGSILLFSRFLGFWGLIIGVPTAALIKFFIDEWKRRQKWKEMHDAKTALEN